MKCTLLAAALLTTAGIAAAQEPLAPVIVEGVDGRYLVDNCTPPTAAPECAPFHQMIRDNFSDREIAALFGAVSAAPEQRGNYSRLRERYDNLVAYVAEYGVPVASVSVGTIDAIPADATYYESTYSEPVRTDVVVTDDDAVIVDDDPDAMILQAGARSDLYPNADRDGAYVYDDDVPPLR
jgi:hypothetical protein